MRWISFIVGLDNRQIMVNAEKIVSVVECPGDSSKTLIFMEGDGEYASYKVEASFGKVASLTKLDADQYCYITRGG